MYDTLLITGGTGSFGRAFTRRLLEGSLARRVVIFSRDEKKQGDMRADFNDERLRFYLGDVRDRDRLRRAFRNVEAVIHAAALKQVDRSALDIMEFKRTIIDGTENVIEAAHDCGVAKVITLSTDKAVESVTPYGSCKSVAEWLTIAGNVYGDTRSCAVRYGNILGSRGSVLETWQRQRDNGEALTITSLEMTRFWLDIGEAVDLVLLALERTGGGEVFIPKGVGRSSVADLARAHFPGVGFNVIGKRCYEKTHEALVAAEEADRLRDCGDVYVLLPHPATVRWRPGPWGASGSPVGAGFSYRSDGG
jgi:UDP-N-acetylglucosamine 4,6-dehydratase